MTNLELAMKHGEVIRVAHSDDEIGEYHDVYSFEKHELDALLAEHLAVNSGEPVAFMDSNDDVITNKRKDYLLDNDIGEEYDTPLYTANPINQELLDAVKSLRDGLKAAIVRSNIIDDMPIANTCHEALASLSPNVTKLLESE